MGQMVQPTVSASGQQMCFQILSKTI